MARNNWSHTTSVAVALVAATEKTVLQVVGGTNVIEAIQGFDVAFDGISNTAVPVVVKLITTSTAGTGTSRTPLKTKDTSTSLLVTGTENHSAEGANANLLKTFYIHPQAGVVYPFNLQDSEIEIASAARLALKITAPAAVNCLATIYGEE